MQRTQSPPSPPLTHSRSSPSLIKSGGSLVSFTPTTEPTTDRQALSSSLTSSSPPTAVTASIDHSPAALAYAKKKSPSHAPRLNAHNRKNSTDDLAGEVEPSPPPKTVSDARLLYRQWRAGTPGSESAQSDPLGTSPKEFIAGILLNNKASAAATAQQPANMSEVHAGSPFDQQSMFNRPQEQRLSRSPDQGSSSSSFVRSPPDTLPRISEKLEQSTPLFANSHDSDLAARLLSEQIASQDSGESSPTKPHGGSYEKGKASMEPTMKKASSYQALAELEKKGYFPAAPKPSARGVQRGLKDSVVNDMCRAVAKHMVGDVYVSTTGRYGTKKVLNHLYEPVLQAVQHHFRRFPARYALSVNPDDVPLHMRLLASHHRNPEEICVSAQLKKEDDGSIMANVCELVVVSLDRDSLLDAITRALTGMKGSITDADVMTTHDGVTLDRFVVKGMFMTEDRQKELKTRIEENLTRSSIDEDAELMNKRLSVNSSTAPPTEQENLAEKLGVLDMVDKNEIKPEWKLDISEIKLDTTVGSGRSGNTYSAWWRGTRVAAKVVDASPQRGSLGEDLLNEFHREVAVVSKLRHPNIVLFLGAAINPPRYCLVFEFMQNGTLTDLIRSRKSPLDFFRIAKEIAMGMNYLHLCSIMHRDLKSDNILLDAHNTVKISDFGLSCVLEIGSSSDLTAETGTYRWMAPEVIRHEPYSNKADVYSFGVVLWEMIAKDQPFRGMTPIQAAFAVARQQMRPALPRHTPLKIGELVEHCWHHDPARRPNFSAILEALPLVQKSLKKRDFKTLGFTVPA